VHSGDFWFVVMCCASHDAAMAQTGFQAAVTGIGCLATCKVPSLLQVQACSSETELSWCKTPGLIGANHMWHAHQQFWGQVSISKYIPHNTTNPNLN
jgi:hypothetical protein